MHLDETAVRLARLFFFLFRNIALANCYENREPTVVFLRGGTIFRIGNIDQCVHVGNVVAIETTIDAKAHFMAELLFGA